jgi:hypothetical protein
VTFAEVVEEVERMLVSAGDLARFAEAVKKIQAALGLGRIVALRCRLYTPHHTC